MKKLKNVLVIFIITLLAFYLFPLISNAELTPEQQKTVAQFAKNFVNEGNNKGILRYDQAYRTVGFNNSLRDGKMYFDCSSFACFIYNQTCKAGLACLDTGGIYSSSKFKKVGKYPGVKPEVGDVLCKPNTLYPKHGHAVIYIGNGKIAHARGKNGKGPTEQVAISDIYTDDFTVLRYKGSPKEVKEYANYTWPNGKKSKWKDEDDLNEESDMNSGIGSDSSSTSSMGTEDYEYQGTQEGTFNLQKYDIDWLIKSLKQILDWFVGITTYLVRMVFIGWSSIIEITINNIAGWIAGEDMSLTIEKLVNNKVPLLDVNFFNFATAGGQKIEQNSISYAIRGNIAFIYYIMRTISIIGLIITLLYLGIRMALSTIAEDKAKYKEMLVSWLVSFIIVFFIHYIMIMILYINESLIELINASFAGGEESLYDSVRSSAYAIQASIGWPALVMYMILIYLLIRFIIIYVKRFLVVAILTFMAPLIGVTYSIDKIKDNKSQSLSNWLKEYTFNVILQSVHALLYTLFVSLAFNMLGTSIMGTFFAFLLINFMFKAESIFKKIFGIKSGSIKDAIKSTAAIAGASKIAKGFVRINHKAVGIVSKPVQKPIKDVAARTKEYRRSDKIDKVENAINAAKEQGKSSVKIGKREYNIGQVIGDTQSFNVREIAEGLVDKDAEIKQSNKDEVKARMSQTLSTVLGSAQAVAAIPMTIVDGSEGLAMASNARKNLKKGINQQTKSKEKGIYDKKNERYKGKNKIVTYARRAVRTGKQVATFGMYGNIKNIKALNKDHLKKVEKAMNNTQHEIAVAQLEKSITKEYSALIENPNIDRNELEEVMKSANKTVSQEAIGKVIYKISAMRQMEIIIKGATTDSNNSSDNQTTQNQTSSGRRNANKKQQKNNDVQSLDKTIAVMASQTKELSKVTEKMKKALKLSKDDAKFDEKKFEKSINNQIKEIISKENKMKKSQIKEEDIKDMFEEMTEADKEKVMKEAVYASITIPKKDQDNLKKLKTGMNLENVNEVIDKISKDKKVSLEQDAYKENFKNYITEEVATSKKKKKEDVNENEINEYISGLSNEELIQKIRIVGTNESSIKRHEAIGKQEYAKLTNDIRNLRYHKEQMKGN